MKLVVISGRSGSGKSTALQALEDIGFYCIDNLPAHLLPQLITRPPEKSSSDAPKTLLAVSIDARNPLSNLEEFPAILKKLREKQNISCELLYLDSNEEVLLKRYSATRRKHPLSNEQRSLKDAIEYERELLGPLAELADLRLDTTRLSLYQLRDSIKLRIMQKQEQGLSIQFESFGFKHGLPLDLDFTYDVRCLPNPYWLPPLREYTGLQQPVIDFLSQETEVNEMLADITGYLEKWLPVFEKNNRSYVTIGIGCTGGHHRSVFIAEQLASHFRRTMDNVHVRHRELP
ncbi:RNase adapter RapZ [Aliamphritea spongicola]|uniref:RNase adapter RapZ n=1 Tax=Aliamphritea spongicola TaxID=707589 RepID=UPI00196A2B3A|nr:RNase adapter RapZ [Aliamphritea spongicola]MBN3564480.1 RNase adapter RapZ [Aliamphritea spongicola]